MDRRSLRRRVLMRGAGLVRLLILDQVDPGSCNVGSWQTGEAERDSGKKGKGASREPRALANGASPPRSGRESGQSMHREKTAPVGSDSAGTRARER